MKTMKTATILICLMPMFSLNALAHPGHDGGAAIAGLSAAEALGLAAIAGAGLIFAASRYYRRRRAESGDD